jgi:hypothetical protein
MTLETKIKKNNKYLSKVGAIIGAGVLILSLYSCVGGVGRFIDRAMKIDPVYRSYCHNKCKAYWRRPDPHGINYSIYESCRKSCEEYNKQN